MVLKNFFGEKKTYLPKELQRMIKRFQSAIEFILKAAGFSCRATTARKATDARIVWRRRAQRERERENE